MFLFKIKNYIKAFLLKIIFMVIYRNRIQFGRNVTFRKGFSLLIDKQGKVVIGDNCFFNNGCSINCLGMIEIGEGSIFGENVKIYDHNHRFSDFSIPIKQQGYSTGRVRIGKHSWIGSNVVMLKGTEIGDNCVIGAGCVISGKVESETIIKMPCKYDYEKIKRADEKNG